MQIGAQRLTLTTGMGLLDRATGRVRTFAPGLDETVAVMSTGPDGGLYIGNSPLRRAFSRCIFPGLAPLVGGIRKWRPTRLELLVRDGMCAGADRARNAWRNRKTCPASVASDRVQLAQLSAQIRAAAATALADGDLPAKVKRHVDRGLDRVDAKLERDLIPRGPFRALCKKLGG